MKADRQGFTLIELMIVVAIIAVIAAMAIPSLLNARKSGYEAKAISTLRSITTSQEIYRRRFGTYAGSLGHLGQSGIMPQLDGTGEFFPQYDAVEYDSAGSWWFMAVEPVDWGTTGDRSFYVDVTGVIRASLSGTATSASPPLD